METTHPSLLIRIRDLGDQVAWSEFDKRYRELVLRYCRRKGLQTSDAEDVRQMAMLSFSKQIAKFEYQPARGRFRDYLGRVVLHSIYRYYRRPRLEQARLEQAGAQDLEAPYDDSLDKDWDAEWMQHHYRLAMAAVRKSADPKSIEVFEELLAGRSVQEVAERFQMGDAAVHKVKQRIRARLAKNIEDQLKENEGFSQHLT